jgi:hypothetical protein
MGGASELGGRCVVYLNSERTFLPFDYFLMIFITFCDGFERLSVQKQLVARPENVWASRNICLRVRKMFGRPETFVCASGKCFERSRKVSSGVRKMFSPSEMF